MKKKFKLSEESTRRIHKPHVWIPCVHTGGHNPVQAINLRDAMPKVLLTCATISKFQSLGDHVCATIANYLANYLHVSIPRYCTTLYFHCQCQWVTAVVDWLNDWFNCQHNKEICIVWTIEDRTSWFTSPPHCCHRSEWPAALQRLTESSSAVASQQTWWPCSPSMTANVQKPALTGFS